MSRAAHRADRLSGARENRKPAQLRAGPAFFLMFVAGPLTVWPPELGRLRHIGRVPLRPVALDRLRIVMGGRAIDEALGQGVRGLHDSLAAIRREHLASC